MSGTDAVLKDGRGCGETPTHAHSHLAMTAKKSARGLIFHITVSTRAKLRMTPYNYVLYVSTQTEQTASHTTASKVISGDAACFMFKAGRGLSELVNWT